MGGWDGMGWDGMGWLDGMVGWDIMKLRVKQNGIRMSTSLYLGQYCCHQITSTCSCLCFHVSPLVMSGVTIWFLPHALVAYVSIVVRGVVGVVAAF